MKKIRNVILLSIMLTLLASCSIRKHVPEDKMILKNNIVEINSKDVDFSKSDISHYISQSATPKFLGFMPQTWIYYKTENKTNKKFYKWVNETIGKKPVYFSNDLKEKSVSQISKYPTSLRYLLI